MSWRINLVHSGYPLVFGLHKADLNTFLLSQIPIPAPMIREITLVRKNVSTSLLLDIFLGDFFSLEATTVAGHLFWSLHCLGGTIFGRELQSQMKSDMQTSLM